MKIDPNDLHIETFCRGRHGGWLPKIDVCVRITHKPTGISAESCDDRSQHKNKAVAYAELEKKLENFVPDKPIENLGDIVDMLAGMRVADDHVMSLKISQAMNVIVKLSGLTKDLMENSDKIVVALKAKLDVQGTLTHVGTVRKVTDDMGMYCVMFEDGIDIKDYKDVALYARKQ